MGKPSRFEREDSRFESWRPSQRFADVVQRRECDRAKVEAMGSSPIIRSKNVSGSLA